MEESKNLEENQEKPLPKELLEALIEESLLLDDHGDAIIGERQSKVDFEKEI